MFRNVKIGVSRKLVNYLERLKELSKYFMYNLAKNLFALCRIFLSEIAVLIGIFLTARTQTKLITCAAFAYPNRVLSINQHPKKRCRHRSRRGKRMHRSNFQILGEKGVRLHCSCMLKKFSDEQSNFQKAELSTSIKLSCSTKQNSVGPTEHHS